MTTAAVYIRKSREEAGKPSHRLTVQREQLPAHAAAQGWKVAIYDDGHASAARGKVEDLRARARLEADIRSGRIDLVLCIELSRLSRDDSLGDYVNWLHLCGEHQVKLATPSRTLDPAQPSDWMLLLMEGGFSSVEMKVLKKRMAEGRRQALVEGRWLGGMPPVPYRYDKESGGLIVDSTALPVVQKIIAMSEGHSTREIAAEVGWPVIKVRRILTEQRLTFYAGQAIDPDTGEQFPGQWPAIIGHEQAARAAAGKRQRKGAAKRSFGGLLSNLGIFVCGYCGRSVRSWKGRPGQPGWYGCKANETARECQPSRLINQAAIDTRIVASLVDTLSDLDALQAAWAASRRDAGPSQKLQEIEAGLEQLRQRKQRLVAAIAEGVITFADARDQISSIDVAVSVLVREREGLLASSVAPDFDSLTITENDFQVLDVTDQRALIRAAIERINLHSDHAVVGYRFPVNLEGGTTIKIELPPPGTPGRRRKRPFDAG